MDALIVVGGNEIVCNEMEYFINMGGVKEQPKTYKELYVNLIDMMNLNQIKEYILAIQEGLDRLSLRAINNIEGTITIPHYEALDDEKISLLKYRPDCVSKLMDVLERTVSSFKFAGKERFKPLEKIAAPTLNLKKLTEKFVPGSDITFAKERMIPIERYYVNVINRLVHMNEFINSF